MELKGDRRSPESRQLRHGALRCEDCGTTWFDQLADQIVSTGRRCCRCGGALHTERRTFAGERQPATRAQGRAA